MYKDIEIELLKNLGRTDMTTTLFTALYHCITTVMCRLCAYLAINLMSHMVQCPVLNMQFFNLMSLCMSFHHVGVFLFLSCVQLILYCGTMLQHVSANLQRQIPCETIVLERKRFLQAPRPDGKMLQSISRIVNSSNVSVVLHENIECVTCIQMWFVRPFSVT